MTFHEPITSVTTFLEAIFKQSRDKSVRCYRGQSNHEWPMLPSVMRDLKINAEKQIFSELMVESPDEFSSDRLMFDKLVRAQHYGLPTRLLDVTLNPLVALFFACNDQSFNLGDGVVKTMTFSKSRVRFADSDTVSLISNLAKLTEQEQGFILDSIQSYKTVKEWTDEDLKPFRKSEEIQRLINFVRMEKPYFTDMVHPKDLMRYFFVYPAKNNRRVIAQSGAFIIAGLLEYISPGETSNSFKMNEIIIPADAKTRIIAELDELNINSRSMFPEIESTAAYIKEKWRKR